MGVLSNLAALQLELPPVPKAVANYVPVKRVGNLLFTSGQLPLRQGQLDKKGLVGANLTLEEAQKEAEVCLLNALAALLLEIPNLEEIQSVVKLGVYVASAEGFTDQHLVANGASNLLVQVFGEKGKHARFAVGVSSLPLGASVELELLVEIK